MLVKYVKSSKTWVGRVVVVVVVEAVVIVCDVRGGSVFLRWPRVGLYASSK